MTPRPGPGPVLAEGRAARVHDLGNGRVLRRYRDPGSDTATEARAMAVAAAAGVPVPRVELAEGTDLILSRIDGPTMLADLLAHPARAAAHGRSLALLHRSLDAVPAPIELGLPVPTGAPGRLLHGDLHPGNVLLSAGGPVLVDWTNAGTGPGAYDTATTWLLLACFDPGDSGTAQRLAAVRGPLLDAFLSAVDHEAAAAVLPVVGAHRQADPATTAPEARRISALVGQWRGGGSRS